jgi:hypothetical protein
MEDFYSALYLVMSWARDLSYSSKLSQYVYCMEQRKERNCDKLELKEEEGRKAMNIR